MRKTHESNLIGLAGDGLFPAGKLFPFEGGQATVRRIGAGGPLECGGAGGPSGGNGAGRPGAEVRMPRFFRARQDLLACSLAARVGKSIRAGFGPEVRRFADPAVGGRLHAAVLRVILRDAQHRVFRARLAGHDLVDFSFRAGMGIGDFLLAPIAVECSAGRDRVAVRVLDLHPRLHLRGPARATHARLVVHAVAVSDVFVAGPLRPELHGLCGTGEACISLCGPEGTVELEATLPVGEGMPDEGRVLVGLGISFLRMVNGRLCPVANGSVMQIVEVL